MDERNLLDWLAPLTETERVRALALLHAAVTVGTRQFFLPGTASGRERQVLEYLHGVNELHHTIANQLVAYSFARERLTIQAFATHLSEIANQYGIGPLLDQAVGFARTRDLSGG